MKDYVNLIKFTWKHYATILLVALVFVIENNYFVLKDLEISKRYVNNLCKLDELFQEKLWGVGLININVVLIALFVILVIKHFAYTDSGKLEFVSTLPMKNGAFYIVDYVLTFGIVFIGGLVDYVTYSVVQIQHNNAVVATLPDLATEAGDANHKLFVAFICYIAVLFFAYNILYLGLVVSKNTIIGLLIALCSWFLVVPYIIDLFNCELGMDVLLINDIFRLERLTQTMLLPIVVVSIIMAAISLIVVKKRELKKGFWCYWIGFDYLVILIAAFTMCAICYLELNNQISIFVGALTLIGMTIFHEYTYRNGR